MSIEQQADRQVPLATPFGRQVQGRGNIRGLGLSVAVHLGLLGLAAWGGHRFTEARDRPGLGPGDAGGGGGGGRVFAVLALPPALPAAPQAPALTVPSLVALTVPELRPPEDVPQQISAQDLLLLERQSSGQGSGQGSGLGPGSGSGSGGGSGSGVGTGTGPGTGGEGGRYYPPQPQGIIMPPPDRPSSLRGSTVTARFEISARGEVTRVSLEPPIRDRRFADEFVDRLRRYTFTPAYTLEGEPIAAVFEIRITL